MSTKATLAILSGLYLLALAFSGVANINFAKAQSFPATYFISGTIRIVSTPISNIKVTLYKGFKRSVRVTETKTDSGGNYLFIVSEKGEYVVKPASSKFIFNPQFVKIFVKSSLSNINFSGNFR